MTINEFRAWLDGFKEAMGDAPTPEQWAKVLAKLEAVQPLVPPRAPTAGTLSLTGISGSYPTTLADLPTATCGSLGVGRNSGIQLTN